MDNINQIAFDRVARHLLVQKRKSLNSRGECRYRAPDGLMCAIGALIDDEHYSVALENYTIDDGKVFAAVFKYLGAKPNRDLLKELQAAHDRFHPCGWRKRLRIVAFWADLSPAVLEEFPQ